MTDANSGDQKVEGRPGAGAELVQGMAEAKARRPRRKDIRPLAHLLPFVIAHKGDGLAAGFFLLFSTAATLGLLVVGPATLSPTGDATVLAQQASAVRIGQAAAAPTEVAIVPSTIEVVVSRARAVRADHADQGSYIPTAYRSR